GDSSCNGDESCSSCPSDCGECSPYCGDSSCNGDESCSSCPSDCGECSPYCEEEWCVPFCYSPYFFNNSEYLFCNLLSTSSQLVNAVFLNNFCLSKNGSLATINNHEENYFLFYQSQLFFPGKNLLFGLNDLESEGNWVYFSGENSAYRNWRSGEPNNVGNEDCSFLESHANGYWNDGSCVLSPVNSFAFVCEKKIFLNGSGTLENPFVITNCQQLQNIKLNLSASYALGNNIDCSDYDFGDGKGFMPIGNISHPFIGNFDGRNFNISGVYINRTDMPFVGLFGYVANSLIKNVGILNGSFFGNRNLPCSDISSTGSLIGWADFSLIENVFSENNFVLGGKCSSIGVVGGIVGELNSSVLRDCYSKKVLVYSTESAGGISGEMWLGSLIDNCSFSEGNIFGRDQVGGIVGQAFFNVNISNSYSIGNLIGDSSVGGLVGYL
ncbi:MAG: C-type lectin domain-containing protein, partial [Candidatus Pacearchaeota archaeon]|nr:C-type lectin domain-containing protein [Candidatus Pacearchaeota archaeon]